jgi:hypothetical protein
MISFLKFLSHPLLLLVACFSFLPCYFLLQLFGLINGRYGNNLFDYWFQIGFTIFLILLWISILLFDILLQCINRKWIWMDHLLFKFEFYYLTLLIIGYEILLQVIGNYSWITFNSIQYHLLFIYQVGWILIPTVITKCRRKKVMMDKIEEIFNNLDIFIMFKDFCHKEYSIENVLCYQDLIKYRKETSQEKRREIVKEMTKLYFSGSSSELEVNISHSIIPKTEGLERLEDDLYDRVKASMMTNLSDTYSRFQFFRPFEKLQKKKRKIKSAIEN